MYIIHNFHIKAWPQQHMHDVSGHVMCRVLFCGLESVDGVGFTFCLILVKGVQTFFQSAGMKVTYTANIARSTFGTKSLDFVPSFGWIKECFM